MTAGHEKGSQPHKPLRELAVVIGAELASLVERMNIEFIMQGVFNEASVAKLRRLRIAAERSAERPTAASACRGRTEFLEAGYSA